MIHLTQGDITVAGGLWESLGDDVYASCPSCNRVMSLRGYLIDVNGVLARRVPCPNNCGFRDFVKLIGWGGNSGSTGPEGR